MVNYGAMSVIKTKTMQYKNLFQIDFLISSKKNCFNQTHFQLKNRVSNNK